MDNDDVLIGRLLSRRAAVRLLGAGGLAALAGGESGWAAQSPPILPGCVVRPELTEGPYFVDAAENRSDIRANTSTGEKRGGVPLVLMFGVSQLAAGRCSALSGADVHVWQCDAAGVYTSVRDARIGAANGVDNALRGVQTTDSQGRARFTTIYPGWYRGRAVHIHFKIRTHAAGQAYEFTSQLFLPEALTDQIHTESAYAAHGTRDTTNDRDGIYREAGAQLLLKPVKAGAGYQAHFDMALDLSDARVGRADGGRGAGRGGRR